MTNDLRQQKEAEPHREEEACVKARLEKLLLAARQEFLLSGEPMLDWHGLELEIAERRGGVSESDHRPPGALRPSFT